MLMSELYLKEKKKVTILLGLGGFLSILFLGGAVVEYGFKEIFKSFGDLSTYFILTMITCYPLGIAYGWRKMLGIATHTESYEPADRYYTVQERTIHKNSILMGWVLRLALVFSFGWIFGTITAFKRLKYLKQRG